jgi:hypothetical protein
MQLMLSGAIAMDSDHQTSCIQGRRSDSVVEDSAYTNRKNALMLLSGNFYGASDITDYIFTDYRTASLL